MEKEKLFDALDGLKAYDGGSYDSGIHDEILRQQVKDYLSSLDFKALKMILTDYILEYYLSPTAIAQGHDIESVATFIRWLDDEMGIYI